MNMSLEISGVSPRLWGQSAHGNIFSISLHCFCVVSCVFPSLIKAFLWGLKYQTLGSCLGVKNGRRLDDWAHYVEDVGGDVVFDAMRGWREEVRSYLLRVIGKRGRNSD